MKEKEHKFLLSPPSLQDQLFMDPATPNRLQFGPGVINADKGLNQEEWRSYSWNSGYCAPKSHICTSLQVIDDDSGKEM